MRIALVAQLAKNKARSKVTQRCMTTIATRITTIVNRRGHSPLSVHSPALLVLTGVAAHGSGLFRYLPSLGLPADGAAGPEQTNQ
jgi:hypothetical protein